MSPEAWFTLAVLVAVLVLLVKEVYSPVAAMAGGLLVLFLGGSTPVLDEFFPASLAFQGFSSSATITIAALYVVATAVRRVGVVDRLVLRMLGTGHGDKRVLARIVAPVALMSGFLNNTPIVATLAPMLRDWAQGRGRSPSTFLMPLSFAAILGGTLTTIGTATTLVVSGLLVSEAGQEPFSMFEISIVGLPVAIIGGILLVLLSTRLLPDREPAASEFASGARRYTFQMTVEENGVMDGQTVQGAGLRNLTGVYLASIDRSGTQIAPVRPDTPLRGGDHLSFVGNLTNVRDLEQVAGLRSSELEHIAFVDTADEDHRFYEVVIGPSSPLIGQTLKELGFRRRYDAAVMAIHRSGGAVDAKLGQVPLRPGDVLLLLAAPGFASRWDASSEFLVVTALFDRPQSRPQRTAIVAATVAFMVIAAGTGLLSILQSALAAVLILTLTRALRLSQARDSVDLDVVLIVASAIGIGAAVQASGLADVVADAISGTAGSLGPAASLGVVMLGTIVLTEMISNAAAASVMVPIGLQVAASNGADPRGYAVAIALMASASFLTPVGYQTNTIVYGLGGYRYSDYYRLGAPLTLTSFVVTLTMVQAIWG